jgi:hypothetical protein
MSARDPLSAVADGGAQMTVEDCLASAAADSLAQRVDRVRAAAAALAAARLAVADAEDLLNREIVGAARAGASVRALGAAAGMGKTRATEIARFGEAGWR